MQNAKFVLIMYPSCKMGEHYHHPEGIVLRCSCSCHDDKWLAHLIKGELR